MREFEGTERFVVRRKIGTGGMGVVYEAFDRARGLPVALKKLHRLDANNIYRMKQEFRALADVSHPNLIQLHELVFEADTWFFTMELVDGVDFLAHIREPADEAEAKTIEVGASPISDTLVRGVPVPAPRILIAAPDDESWAGAVACEFSTIGEPARPTPETMAAATKPRVSSALQASAIERTRETLRQLAEGMIALHEVGKLHRDIKPSNVLVTKNGRVVLLDFGLVTEMYEEWLIKSTAEGMVCGTIAYMAPEQGAGLILGPASDWYSVGVMLFEALTGRLPFEGKLFDVLMKKQARDPPRPRDLVPDVPEDLDRLAFDLLVRDPEKRPTGKDVLARLGGGGVDGGVLIASTPSWNVSSSFQGLIGREVELNGLEEIFAVTGSGRPAIAHVFGKSGIGKSALVRRFLDRLIEEERAVVFGGRCYERELVPYKAMDNVIDALSRYLRKQTDERTKSMLGDDARALSRIFPVLTRVEVIARARGRDREVVDPLELRRRAFHALARVFREIAARDRPVVIFIDDAQWGDGDSAALLSEVLGGADAPPLLLILGYRNDDRAPSPLVRVLSQAMPAGSVSQLQLPVGPLSLEESEQLARIILPPDREARAKPIAQESGGSPLFVHELAAFGGEELKLEAALAKRIQIMSEDAQRLLAVIATSARPISVASANRAAGLSGENRIAIGALRNARLVRMRSLGQGEDVEVYHDRIADAALRGRSPESIRMFHVALLAELERSDEPDPEALVVHLRAAGELRRAGEHAVLAAKRAEEALAFDRAASLLEIGVQLAITFDPDGEEHADGYPAQAERAAGFDSEGRSEGSPRPYPAGWELRGALGDALVKASRGAEAADAYLGAAANAPPLDAIEMKRRAAEALLRSGYVDRGLAVIREVLKALDIGFPETHESAYRMAAMQRLELLVRGLRFREKPASEISREDRIRIDALWSAATGLAMVDSVRSAYFHSRGMVLALRTGDPYRFARSLAIEACIVGGSDPNGARGERVLDLLREYAVKLDSADLHGLVALASGFVSFLRGEWSPAIDALERSLSIFEERCTGAGWQIDTAQLLIMSCLTYRGDMQSVPRRVQKALYEADLRRNRYISTILRTSPNVNVAFAAIDRTDEAREAADASIARWSQEDFHLQHYHLVATHVLFDLYDGEYLRAWARFARGWEQVRGAQLQRLALVRFESRYVRARAALAAASIGHDAERLVEIAQDDAREIASTEMIFAAPIAASLRAQVASVRGESELAEKELLTAIEGFAKADMALHRAAALVRLGQLRGGSAGDALVQEGEGEMKARGVVDPERMALVYAPVRWG